MQMSSPCLSFIAPFEQPNSIIPLAHVHLIGDGICDRRRFCLYATASAHDVNNLVVTVRYCRPPLLALLTRTTTGCELADEQTSRRGD
jgi:hypothetical protein